MKLPIFEIHTDNAVAALDALDGASGIVDAALFGRSLHVMVEAADAEGHAAQAAFAAAGRQVEYIERVQPSLEDVFVSLVRGAGGAAEG